MKSKHSTFTTLIRDEAMLHNLQRLGYLAPTPIQDATLPLILDKKDVIAQAKTGSGKTAAFGLALLLNLHVKSAKLSSLVLCPTRELAEQVAKELRRLAQFAPNIKIVTLCGGTRFAPQVASLAHGAHIAVGTPGRVWQHLCEKTLNLHSLQTLVLDEADRMLEMGFSEDVMRIIAHTPKHRQSLLFSATFPKEVEALALELTQDAKRICVDEAQNTNIEQAYMYVLEAQKKEALKALLCEGTLNSAMVFCKTKLSAQEIGAYLWDEGFDATSLHGDLEQIDRDERLIEFTHQSLNVLVATDVASRGLHINDVELVVNYDVPLSLEIYTHRIGRTGRMGEKGKAVTFITPEEEGFLNALKASQTNLTCKEFAASKNARPKRALYATLCIDAGKKHKMRAGDILGALTKDVGLEGSSIGKITITDKYSYVAVLRAYADKAYEGLCATTIKNRRLKIWKLG
jgi:ATP-independent RNA helicase DbpA